MTLPHNFLAGLGAVVAAWSKFEYNLGVVVITMISPDINTGTALIKELRFRALADAALNVYRAHIGEDESFEELEAIIHRAELLEPTRNELVHSLFSVSEADKTKVSLWKVTAKRKGIKRLGKIVEISSLEELAQKLDTLSGDILAFHHKIISEGKTKYVRLDLGITRTKG